MHDELTFRVGLGLGIGEGPGLGLVLGLGRAMQELGFDLRKM